MSQVRDVRGSLLTENERKVLVQVGAECCGVTWTELLKNFSRPNFDADPGARAAALGPGTRILHISSPGLTQSGSCA